MKFIFLVLLSLLNSTPYAASMSPELNHYQVRYSFDGNVLSSNHLELNWDLKKKTCNLKMDRQKKSAPIKIENCTQVKDYLQSHWDEFSKLVAQPQNARSKALASGPHAEFAELEIEGKQIGVLKHKVEWCDDQMKNCKTENRNAADELGEMLRQIGQRS